MLSQNQNCKASASEEDTSTSNNQRSDFFDIYGPQVFLLSFSQLLLVYFC